MGRAPCCDKANVKRGPWSPEEDEKLKSYIEKHGTGGNWIALPQKIGLKRCGKSCRLRWLNYLRPNIKHGGFTEDEDNLICSLYISIGSRWSIIAAQLPGRTDNDIKNYWNTRLKKKLLGRQRREQQARRERCSTKQIETKRGGQNYSINECFNLYPRPPQPVAPPFLPAGYSSLETRLHDQASNSLTNISIMPPLEARISFDHPQVPNNKGENFGNFCYNSDVSFAQNQHLFKNSTIRLVPSTCTSFINSSTQTSGSDFHGISGVPANDFQTFDGIPEDIIYRMPQQLDGLESFSAVDMVNSSTTTVSPESTISWGDISCLVYPSALSSYEVFQRKTPQDWAFFDEQRLIGYSE
ncbi:hypothetical protein Pfo_019318 [Paulownia fortunei]|nr:hypothetical protein Pfo_019318 [Paulownia fortunei]